MFFAYYASAILIPNNPVFWSSYENYKQRIGGVGIEHTDLCARDFISKL